MKIWAWLKARFAFVFLIGLALAVASFVENLQMARDAIQFVGQELSEVTGWEDFFRALAATIHASLEWWRGILRGLFDFLHISIPLWVHDALSILFFGTSRGIAIAHANWRNEAWKRKLEMSGRHSVASRLYRSLGQLSDDLVDGITVSVLIVALMIIAIIADRFYSGAPSTLVLPDIVSFIGISGFLALFAFFSLKAADLFFELEWDAMRRRPQFRLTKLILRVAFRLEEMADDLQEKKARREASTPRPSDSHHVQGPPDATAAPSTRLISPDI